MEKIKCSKCGKLYSKNGLRMHELTCNGLQKEDIEKSQKCVHDLTLLHKNVESQYRAILDGYSAYCKKCGELI
jgi:hypothetical protein